MTNLIELLIVEDELDFQSILTIYASSIEHVQVSLASNYSEAIALLKEKIFHITVLDIDLGKDKKSGIDIARYMRNNRIKIPIVFITHNFTNTYYELARELGASSFLDKHLSRLKFRQAIELAIQRELTIQDFFIKEQKSILIKVGPIYKKIDLKTIDFFFTQKGFSYAHTGNVDYPLNVTLTELSNLLRTKFIRIHQSYLINVEKVTSIDTRQNQITIGKQELPIGTTHRQEVLSFFTLLR